MNVVNMNPSELKPYIRNNRKHPKEQIDKLAKQISAHGWDVPIVVDKDLVIIKGHGRLKAAKQLKLKTVPVIVRDDLTEEQCNAARLADNKLGELAEIDMAAIQLELDALKAIDFDLDLTAFDSWNPFAEEAKEEAEGLTDPDDVPELKPDPKSKLGDVWLLGDHRVMCGDSTDAGSVAILMNGQKAELCFTSPPYNAGSMNIKGNETTKRKYDVFDDNQDDDAYFEFLRKNMELMLNNSTEVFYNIGLVQNNKKAIVNLQNAFIGYFKDIIYWKKHTSAPHIQPGIINNLVEFILCFGDGKRKFTNAQFSQGTYWNVIEGTNASGNEFSKIHKATFPVYLPENIVNNFSRHGTIILEPFTGTGTTLIACEKTGRKCYGMELSPQYVDVIIKRWQDFTGKKAVREDGTGFDAI
jgi:DNA modification methylase